MHVYSGTGIWACALSRWRLSSSTCSLNAIYHVFMAYGRMCKFRQTTVMSRCGMLAIDFYNAQTDWKLHLFHYNTIRPVVEPHRE